MEAKEPAVAYYTGAMMDAMRMSIVNSVKSENDAEKLEHLYSFCFPNNKTFAEQYAESKAFCEKAFPKDMWPKLAEHNYFVHHMLNDTEPETEEDLEKLLSEADEEADFAIPHEKVEAFFKERFGW